MSADKVRDINQEVLRALGFGGVDRITRLSLDLVGCKLPTVSVERVLSMADVDKLQTVVDVYALTPKAE